MTTIAQSLDKLLGGQLSFINHYYKVIAISSPENELLETVGLRENVKTIPITFTRQITPIRDYISLVKLLWLIQKERPTIVHTHTPKAGLIGMIAAKISCVPIRLHTVAGLPLLEARGFKRKVLNIVEKLTYMCASKIYPNSHGLKEIILQNKYCKKGKLKVLANGSSNGIDTKLFSLESIDESKQIELTESLHITSTNYLFVYVGRIVKDKGINELAEAFHKLSLKYQIVKLILVGPYENQLDPVNKHTLNIIKNNKNIIEVGFQNDIRPYFAISNALVFPSYREGFPNAVLQAGAMGLPSIVTNINGCNEIIKDGINGKIIPPKNVTALHNAMEEFVNKPDMVAQLAQNSRKVIVDRYEQKLVWEAIKNEYDNLLTKYGLQ